MPRGDPKPKVAFHWREEGRYIHARCKLGCGFAASDSSRSMLYVSTAAHKDRCPVLLAWEQRQREAFLREMEHLL